MKPIHKIQIICGHSYISYWSSYANGMVGSCLALPTSFRTASLKSALGKYFLSAEGRDSK